MFPQRATTRLSSILQKSIHMEAHKTYVDLLKIKKNEGSEKLEQSQWKAMRKSFIAAKWNDKWDAYIKLSLWKAVRVNNTFIYRNVWSRIIVIVIISVYVCVL